MTTKSLLLILIVSTTIRPALSQPTLAARSDVNPALIYWKEFLVMATFYDHAKVEANHAKAAIDADYEQVVQRYDDSFRRLAQARRMTVPCDWGDDLTEGPNLLLPYLLQAKQTARTARLRIRHHLETGTPDQAVEDLLTAFTLARHIGQEQILINVLVEIAINAMLVEAVAENFHLFSEEASRALRDGLADLPEGGSIASSVARGEAHMVAWGERMIRDIVKSAGGDEAKALAEIEEEIGVFDADLWDDILKATDGQVAGILELWREIHPFYEDVVPLFRLPPRESLKAIEAHMKKVETSGHPFLAMVHPQLTISRRKELENQVRLTMLEAALTYKLEGAAALTRIPDPFSDGQPFALTRVRHKGEDRGFALVSAFENSVVNRQAFVETPGERFRLSGDDLGKPRTP